MSGAERTYRLLLRAYPAAFRARFAREMVLAFRAQRREARASETAFWLATLWDVARSAPALRLEALRTRRGRATNFQLGEGTMKTMAILAVVIGLLDAANALGEAFAGRWFGDPAWVVSVALGVAGGVLLLAGGIAMLRSSGQSAVLLRGAAIACLVAFVIIALVKPVMSMAAMILGIGFPIALLVFLYSSRGRGRIAA